MRKATCAAACAAFLSLAGAAHAADLSEGVSYKDTRAPIVVSGTVWTGFYVGAGIGAGAVVHDLDVDSDDYYSDISALALDGGGDSFSFDGIGGEGIFGTIQAGYDRQIGSRIVLGAFIDYDFSNIETEIKAFGESADIELDDMWSVGVRLGYLLNEKTMLYGLLAYTEASFDAGKLDEIVDIDDFSGYSVGVGLETNLHGGWFLKGEYRFTQLDSESLLKDYDNIEVVRVAECCNYGDVDADLEPSIHTARIVLTYKFGRDGYHEPLK